METPAVISITCPHCHKPSDSIKSYRVPFAMFIGIGAGIKWQGAVGCPACMRKGILLYTLINVVTANILWPFLILPTSIFALSRSFEKGHDAAILTQVRIAQLANFRTATGATQHP